MGGSPCYSGTTLTECFGDSKSIEIKKKVYD